MEKSTKRAHQWSRRWGGGGGGGGGGWTVIGEEELQGVIVTTKCCRHKQGAIFWGSGPKLTVFGSVRAHCIRQDSQTQRSVDLKSSSKTPRGD